MSYRFLIAGAGFSGCVLANQLIQKLDCRVDLWDERDHLGGNCHTERDEKTGIMVHQYGPHIFNTDRKDIWDFVNGFGNFRPYVHRVKATSNGKVYSFPINLLTLNQFFERSFSPDEARRFFEHLGDKSIANPSNFEEQALSFVGKELYRAFFYGYTKKQWGCEPSQLPASVLKRIPVRFNYDDNYHTNIYTGIPEEGYSAVMTKMITDPKISLTLNKKFHSGIDSSDYDHIFFTGPLDAYFNYEFGRLGYRTVTFEKFYGQGDFQGLSQMNYCDEHIPFTRITEHKHFAPWEQHEQTVYFREFSKETTPEDTPFYPKRLEADKILLQQYREKAQSLTRVSFLGRLATYRYMDMHQVIGEALQLASDFTNGIQHNQPLPVFSNTGNP